MPWTEEARRAGVHITHTPPGRDSGEWVDLLIDIYECHTDGSPLLRNAAGRWDEEREAREWLLDDAVAQRAATVAQEALEALIGAREECPCREETRMLVRFCKRCTAFFAAELACEAFITFMEAETIDDEELAAKEGEGAVRSHVYWEGACDGFSQRGALTVEQVQEAKSDREKG